MKTIDALIPLVQVDVFGCPDPFIRSAIIRAAIDFCETTTAIRSMESDIPIVDGVATSDIDAPSSSVRLVQILNVWASSSELTPKSMGQIAQLLPNWQSAQGSPVYYNQPTAGEYRVYPIPVNSNGATLTINAAFAPKLSATTLDDELVDNYFEAITAKAKAILMMVPAKAWTNPQLAIFFQSEYQKQCDMASIDMLHDRTRGSLHVSPRSFG